MVSARMARFAEICIALFKMVPTRHVGLASFQVRGLRDNLFPSLAKSIKPATASRNRYASMEAPIHRRKNHPAIASLKVESPETFRQVGPYYQNIFV